MDDIVGSNGQNLADYIKESEGEQPLNKVITLETLNEVEDKFGKILNDNEKKAIGYSIQGKKPEEIAKILGINSKKVYNLLYRARKKMKIE